MRFEPRSITRAPQPTTMRNRTSLTAATAATSAVGSLGSLGPTPHTRAPKLRSLHLMGFWLMAATVVHAGTDNPQSGPFDGRKVLIIGIDGCRPRCLAGSQYSQPQQPHCKRRGQLGRLCGRRSEATHSASDLQWPWLGQHPGRSLARQAWCHRQQFCRLSLQSLPTLVPAHQGSRSRCLSRFTRKLGADRR